MLPVHINAMTYELLQEMYAGQTVKEKMAKWMSSIGHEDMPLKLAKDNTWLAERGINEEPHRKDAASAVLCAYDVNMPN